ncbi:ABC transporter ATP-binding protein [Candidatus Margulisiibacteriota bacterium]
MKEKIALVLKTIRFRIKYFKDLVIGTPRYPIIISLSLIGGCFSFVGLPMIIPVLEYLQNGAASSNNQILLMMENILKVVGIQPGFYSVLAIACTFILVGEILVVITTLIAMYSSYDLIKGYSARLLKAYLKVNWLWLTSTNSGEINYVVLKEAELAAACHLSAQRVVISGIQCMAYFMLAMKMSFWSVFLAVLVYSVLSLANLKNSYRLRGINKTLNSVFKATSNILVGLQRNKKFLKTSLLNKTLIDNTISRINEINTNYKHMGMRLEFQRGGNFITMFLFLITLIIFHKQLALGYASLLVLLLVFNRLAPQFNMLFSSYGYMNSYVPMHSSVTGRLNEMDDNIEPNGATAFSGEGPLRFEDVSFTYPNGTRVVDKLSLTIEPFSSVAIVGGSGAGKTTILDLILGLLRPDSGKIMYGDILHSDLDMQSLRNKVAYVSQEPTLIDGTLKDNITVGLPDASDRMIEDICKKVHIDKFIDQLPDGLLTPVGENGVKLSGGQRQRVVLARSLFLNPKIMILDEATSELDSESEKMIQQTIRELSKELTIIIVAHRLSTVKFVDCVHVLEKGGIVESGSYQKLLEKKGRLYQLDLLQK